MVSFHFGSRERRLFGILHPRHPAREPQASVLLLAPFGHEAIRTHRFYRVLAERLARQGHDVFRFDYFGTGDSAGSDEDVCLAGWVADIWTAHAELLRRSGWLPQWWVGARLGASAALKAQLGWRQDLTNASPPSLLVCDPVLDGKAYLDGMRVKHVEALEASYSVADRRWRQDLADPSRYLDEAIGFVIPADLREEVLALEPRSLQPLPGARVEMVCSPGDRVAPAWAERQAPSAPLHWLDQRFDWTSDDSLNTALVPADAMNLLQRILHG